jgi:subtilisin family serine protease
MEVGAVRPSGFDSGSDDEPSLRAGGIRVAIIDSGVHAAHPHVRSVAGGVTISEQGEHPDYADRLGHGTAVAAVIREKAPEAELFAVRIFADRLTASVATLVRALDWASRSRMHLVNLSLGTTRPDHEPALRGALHRAAASGVCVVAARDDDGVRYLPGSVPHVAVVPVQLDWACPRDTCYTVDVDGGTVYRASGWPRPITGVPPSRNLSGISFAVANVTGVLANRSSLIAHR